MVTTDWIDVITGHTLSMITQGNGWYLQSWAGVDVLETSVTRQQKKAGPKLTLLMFYDKLLGITF